MDSSEDLPPPYSPPAPIQTRPSTYSAATTSTSSSSSISTGPPAAQTSNSGKGSTTSKRIYCLKWGCLILVILIVLFAVVGGPVLSAHFHHGDGYGYDSPYNGYGEGNDCTSLGKCYEVGSTMLSVLASRTIQPASITYTASPTNTMTASITSGIPSRFEFNRLDVAPPSSTSSILIYPTGFASHVGVPHHLSGGQIAGIVVGVVAFVFLLLSGILCFIFRKSLRSRLQKMGILSNKSKDDDSNSTGNSDIRSSKSYTGIAEISSHFSTGSTASAGPNMIERACGDDSASSPAYKLSLSSEIPLPPIDIERGNTLFQRL